MAAVWADCAECGEPLTDADGSLLLVLDDLLDRELVCCCGQANRLPKRFAATRTPKTDTPPPKPS